MLFPLFDRQPTTRFPILTILLIVVNLGIAFWSTTLPDKETLDLVYERGLVPERLTSVDSGKPLPIVRDLGDDRIYRTTLNTEPTAVYSSLLTMMFLHGGWLHVITNMWMLWVFGNNIEDRLGHFTFAAFYLLGGLAAGYLQWAIDPTSQTPVVGASGAVWAVLGGYAVTYPKAKVLTLVFVGVPFLLNLPALLVIAIYFAIDLAMGILMLQGMPAQPIAHWAHVGGCVAGVVLLPLLGIGTSPPDSDWRGEADAMLQPIAPTDDSQPPKF
ncbi:MAG: rhomboid family intramembrane serine protease [Planctomycetota bacterium]